MDDRDKTTVAIACQGGGNHTVEILAAVDEQERTTTSGVADELEVSRQAADYRLWKLADATHIQKKKTTASLIWSLVKDEKKFDDQEGG